MTTTTDSTTRMREQRAGGMSLAAIAAEHGVSVSTVRRRTTGVSPRRRRPPPGPKESKVADTGEMWRLWVSGVTQSDLAKRYDLAQATVSERLAIWRKNLPETERETVFRRELDLLDDLRRRQLRIAYNEREDTAVRLAAMRDALKGSERLAKMLGFDAATSIDATVRYVIEGVPVDAHQ